MPTASQLRVSRTSPAIFAVGFTSLIASAVTTWAAAASAEKTTFEDHVLPILRNHCLNCHNPDKKKADLDASNYNGIMAGGGSGKVLVAEDAANSLLWKLINHLDEPHMPPKAAKLPDPELAMIKKWIDGGLLENSGSKTKASKKPKMDIAVASVSAGKPAGPPPMPNGDLLLEPVIQATRAGAIPAVAASPWAPLLAVSGQKQVLLYHLDTLEIQGILPFPEGFPYVVKFSRSGQLLIAGGGIGAKLGKVAIFNVTTGARIAEVGDELDTVMAADISPDQSQVALGGPSKMVRIYATATGELLHTIKKHTEWVTSIAYSPDGVLLASADRNGGVYLWESGTANAYSELKSSSPQAITDLAWRDDSNAIATTGEDGKIGVWEVENSTRVLNITAHSGGSRGVSFAHDGRLVSTGRDRITKMWDAAGTQQRAFEAFGDIGLTVAISHDMTRVIAGDYSGSLRVWNAADGKLHGTLDANPPHLATRLEKDSQRLVDAKMRVAKLTSERETAATAEAQAISAWRTAQQNATNRTAEATTALGASTGAKEALAKSQAAREQAKKEGQSRQIELTSKSAALTAAQASFAQAQSIAKQAQETLTSAEAAQKAANELSAKAKTAAEASPGVADLVAAANQVKAAAEQTAASVASLQKGGAEVVSRVKAGETFVQQAQGSLAQAQSAFGLSQEAVNKADQTVTNAEAILKQRTDAHQKAQGASIEAMQTATSAEAQSKAATAALAKTKSQVDGASLEVAGIEKQLARWRAGQFNLQVFSAAEERSRKQSAVDTATARAEELKITADRAAAALSQAKKALADSPSVVQVRSNELSAASTAFESAKAALPSLQSSLSSAQTNSTLRNATMQSALIPLTKSQALLKLARDGAVSAAAVAKAATEAAAKSKATADANPAIASLADAATKSQQAATLCTTSLEAASQSMTEIGDQVKTLTALHDIATTDAGAAEKMRASCQQAFEKQPAVIKACEATVISAREALTAAKTRHEQLPKTIASLEIALSQATLAVNEANETAKQAIAALTPVKEKHQQLLAQYQKLKPAQ